MSGQGEPSWRQHVGHSRPGLRGAGALLWGQVRPSRRPLDPSGCRTFLHLPPSVSPQDSKWCTASFQTGGLQAVHLCQAGERVWERGQRGGLLGGWR